MGMSMSMGLEIGKITQATMENSRRSPLRGYSAMGFNVFHFIQESKGKPGERGLRSV